MGWFSQFGEDRWIVENLKPPVGTFCEVGAFDGVTSSNSLYFEQQGWRGVCIEPDPRNAAKCLNNRSAVTWCCAAGVSGLRPFFVNPTDPGAGGLERDGHAIPVVVCSLEELVVASGFKELDLLSIDTEGTELQVWRSRGRFHPKIVIVEFLSLPNPPKDKEVLYQFEQDGYREVYRTDANLILVPR